MSLYQDEAAIRDNATAIAGRAAKKKSRKIWGLAAFGTVFAGGAAFAAVQLFGFGSIDADAATLKSLDVSNVHLTGTLVPGSSVGGSSYVGNGNDFTVKVKGIIIQDSSLAVKGDGCDPTSLTVGGASATYPGSGGGAGHLINLATPVTITAGNTVEVNVPGVVSQAASATKLCGVKANFAVVAEVGN
jgi:hypothetical protein